MPLVTFVRTVFNSHFALDMHVSALVYRESNTKKYIKFILFIAALLFFAVVSILILVRVSAPNSTGDIVCIVSTNCTQSNSTIETVPPPVEEANPDYPWPKLKHQ